ncbi:hypothetical protein CJ206_08470, partial [Dolosicoccus paucivorans]|uniref:hypothetical protein n=1 Tax=Dolosicoccus paucivorans TaxID=84521 RepID=UPI000CAA4ADC
MLHQNPPYKDFTDLYHITFEGIFIIFLANLKNPWILYLGGQSNEKRKKSSLLSRPPKVRPKNLTFGGIFMTKYSLETKLQ